MREHIGRFVKQLPNSLDQSTTSPFEEMTVRDFLRMFVYHALHHIDQITETRKIHN
ncbi:hypothetical protein AWH56_010545 [Anaerobacillus isosaccharinicus]|uniref:DinB-like domain-containing protein n=1 Tax=Anaerobacillus isosaccharinicus TaxID=1532552 RepID=A0A7S7LCJ1_9BACI|nr:hypothetical protein [Anaerobacillus isosaccharinicus]QOY38559.1 hypothetical protein AWH56_010545 [Anaerobacillus isosaccharinicus]